MAITIMVIIINKVIFKTIVMETQDIISAFKF